MNKPDYITNKDWELLKEKYHNLKEIEEKLQEKYPVQYLIGHVSFYGYPIKVNENVLIPRFETETFVEKIIKYITKLELTNSTAIDLGTGTGAIAITIKKEIPNINISALDNSPKALEIAKENSKINQTNINFIQEDIFKYEIKDYDIIISNPPYIPLNSNYDKKILFEPVEAIFVSEEEPLKYYKAILENTYKNIKSKHLICFEIDESYGKEIENLANLYYPKDKKVIEKDLCNKDRYVFIYHE